MRIRGHTLPHAVARPGEPDYLDPAGAAQRVLVKIASTSNIEAGCRPILSLGAIDAVPIDAKIARDSDVAAEALRISDYARPLAALKLKASIVVLDAAPANLFSSVGFAACRRAGAGRGGPGLLSRSTAAGTVAPDGQCPYGVAEMFRDVARGNCLYSAAGYHL